MIFHFVLLFTVNSDTLIKDIPYRLRDRIERLLDPPDANHRDWRGMAFVMDLSAEEVRQLESARDNGKMKGLIERMIQTHKTVNDLLGWLKHPDVLRLDVIDEIKKERHNLSKLLIEDNESFEDQELGLLFLCVLIGCLGILACLK